MNQKSRTVAACALFLLLGFSVFGIGSILAPQNENLPAMEADPIPETRPEYVLKLHEDRLAVFLSTDPEIPIEITDIHASSLRHFDREQLKRGVVASSREELLLLLEDFGS